MSTIVKETELSGAPPATAHPPVPQTVPPTVPPTEGLPSRGNSASGEILSKPQPVALEVSVTVNGARTVAGGEKREPFSESTKTVLVFGNGAVIRLQSSVSAGQLLFLTNEKTKKEVVCQVVKSKNYRNVSGYVELEFTEPVPGFWGMRFPGERIAAPPNAASAQAAPPQVLPPAGSAVIAPAATIAPLPAQTAPAHPPAASSAPLARPKAPESGAPANPSLPVEAAPAAPRAVGPVPPPLPERKLAAPATSETKLSAPETSGNPPPTTTSTGQLSATQFASAVLNLANLAPAPPPANPPFVVSGEVSVSSSAAKSVAPLAAVITLPRVAGAQASPLVPSQNAPDTAPSARAVPAAKSSVDESTEALKAENARLQQQLSALLFAEAQKSATLAQSQQPAKSSSAADTPGNILEPAQNASPAEAASKSAPAKFPPAATHANGDALAPGSKVAPPPLKSLFEHENLKIPAWLEPLARNAAISAPPAELPTAQATNAAKTDSPAKAETSAPFVELHAPAKAPSNEFRSLEQERLASHPAEASPAELHTGEVTIPETPATEPHVEHLSGDDNEDFSHLPAPNFGGGLRIDEHGGPAEGAPPSSKILPLAIAAAVLLAMAGGLFYTPQGAALLGTAKGFLQSAGASPKAPANPPSALSAPPASPSNSPIASPASAVPLNSAGKPSPANLAGNTQAPGAIVNALATPAPLNAHLVVNRERTAQPETAVVSPNGTRAPNAPISNVATAAGTQAALAQPAAPAPKRTSLGDVHLATPTVARRSDVGSITDADPGLNNSAAPGDAPAAANFAGSSPVVPSAPVSIGGDVKTARLLKSVPPVYPSFAKEQRISGDVVVDALIDATGKVTTMKVLNGPAVLHNSAMEALRQWRYQPATLDGTAVPMHLTVTIQFRIPR
jgi:TonB family protein